MGDKVLAVEVEITVQGGGSSERVKSDGCG